MTPMNKCIKSIDTQDVCDLGNNRYNILQMLSHLFGIDFEVSKQKVAGKCGSLVFWYQTTAQQTICSYGEI